MQLVCAPVLFLHLTYRWWLAPLSHPQLHRPPTTHHTLHKHGHWHHHRGGHVVRLAAVDTASGVAEDWLFTAELFRVPVDANVRAAVWAAEAGARGAGQRSQRPHARTPGRGGSGRGGSGRGGIVWPAARACLLPLCCAAREDLISSVFAWRATPRRAAPRPSAPAAPSRGGTASASAAPGFRRVATLASPNQTFPLARFEQQCNSVREPSNNECMAVNSGSFGSPHVRCAPPGHASTCCEANTNDADLAAASTHQAWGRR